MLSKILSDVFEFRIMKKNLTNFFTLLIIGTTLICCEKDKNKGIPVDGDGNVYDTVVIGTQVWLKENLKTTKYNDGYPIPLIKDNALWSTYPVGAYCWYENSPIYKEIYGALYNWHATRSELFCPDGWHVPTKEEWAIMIDYLGGDNVAGSKLKEAGFEHWKSPNEDATNEFDFYALPGGSRYFGDGSFDYIKTTGYWWTSSPYQDETAAWRVKLTYHDGWAEIGAFNKPTGMSIRCIKDK